MFNDDPGSSLVGHGEMIDLAARGPASGAWGGC
jgi:hypothetical protein